MYLIVLLIFGLTLTANAQPDSLWGWSYGGAGPDLGQAVTHTADGNWFFAGQVDVSGSSQVTLIKMNGTGNTVWVESYPVAWAGSSVQAIHPTGDGGCVLATGHGVLNTWFYWSYLLRIDADGDTLWTRRFLNLGDHSVAGIAAADEGSFLVVGLKWVAGNGGQSVEIDSTYALKVSASGDVVWQRSYNISAANVHPYAAESPEAVIPVADGFVLCGMANTSDDPPAAACILTKLNLSGQVQWTQWFHENGCRRFDDLVQTPDGGFAIAGAGDANIGLGWQYRLTKTDGNGNMQWFRDFGGTGTEFCKQIALEEDGYLLSGSSESFGAGSYDFWLVRTNLNGDSAWSRTFGGPHAEHVFDMDVTADGSIAMLGYGLPSPDGNPNWSAVYLSYPTAAGDPRELPVAIRLNQNYPNPFNAATVFTFHLPQRAHVAMNIYDITGRVVATLADGIVEAGEHSYVYDAGSLPSGTYVYRLHSDRFTQSRTMTVLK